MTRKRDGKVIMSDAPQQDQRLLRTPEVIELLRISRASLHRLIARGDLTAYRVGGSLRFRRDDVLAVIKLHTPAK